VALLRADPHKPHVAALPDFDEFRREAFTIEIGSNLKKIDWMKARQAYRQARHRDKVLLTVDSNGGFIEYTSQINEIIYDLMDSEVDVRILATGKCYSAAMSIFTILPAERRYCISGTVFMSTR
jgi:ATP-dependent protease ClpP protease subunit